MNIIKSAKISRFLLKSVRDFNEFHTPRPACKSCGCCSAGMEAWPYPGTVSDPPAGSTLQGHLQDEGNENAITRTQQVIIEEGAPQAHSLSGDGGQQFKNEAGKLAIHKPQAWYSAPPCMQVTSCSFPLSMGKGVEN